MMAVPREVPVGRIRIPGATLLVLSTLVLLPAAGVVTDGATAPLAAQEAASPDTSTWRPLEPDGSLYMELPGGRVVIELAPEFAPNHVENIRTLVRQGYFDATAVVRSQDNYVVQWGDPEGGRGFEDAQRSLEAELARSSEGLPFTPLPDGDVYAPEVGFTRGFPAARDPETGRMWLAHCYGMVGVARGNDPDSGSGAQLYVVTGHSPRHLDRNATMVGRVVQGMEVLSTLPRGSGPLGFYQDPEEPVPIRSARLGSELPAGERAAIEIMRTDSEAFRSRIEARRTRTEEWFVHPAGRIELCNVGVPTRSVGGS